MRLPAVDDADGQEPGERVVRAGDEHVEGAGLGAEGVEPNLVEGTCEPCPCQRPHPQHVLRSRVGLSKSNDI